MGSLYKRGSIWWVAFRDESGRRILRSTEMRDERNARRVLEALQAAVASGKRAAAPPTTVAGWRSEWAKTRKNWNKKRDLAQLDNHVIPTLGSKLLAEVTQDDIRLLVGSWKLAPRSVRNVFWVMSRMFSDAVQKKLIDATPCVLLKGDRPAIADADRRWRKTAVFTRNEAELLLSSPLVPADRHVLWALGFGAGLRLGEVSGLRWRDYEAERKPLGCLSITTSYTRVNGEEKGTKTETPREVPVHPALAAVLADWKLSGWARFFGRPPKDNDLVLPNRLGRHLTDNNVHAGRVQDFAALELRHRRFHDARRTFISLAQAGGAPKDHLKLVTHGAPGEVMDLYTTLPWATLCEAVTCLGLERRGAAPVRLLQTALQSPEGQMQPSERLDNLTCPRRDSNPSSLADAGHSRGNVQRVEGGDPHVREHQPDEDCSNRSNPAEMGRRARALLKRYGGGGAR